MCPKEINIYCDESCHLLNDNSNVMGFGSIWAPKAKRITFCKEIRALFLNDISFKSFNSRSLCSFFAFEAIIEMSLSLSPIFD